MKKRRAGGMITYLVLAINAAVVIMPLIWVVITSFKTNKEYVMNSYALPQHWEFDNFTKAFNQINMPILFKNSIVVCCLSVVIVILITAMAAYVIARFNFKFGKFCNTYFIIGMMIPLNSAIIPLFISFSKLKLTNSLLGLVIPYVAFQIPMGIFLIGNYMRSLPNELEESAMIDGCSSVKIFYKIIFPLCKPIFATFGIITFITNWNEFLFALVLLTSPEYQTIPIGLASFKGEHSFDTPVMLAAVLMTIIPVIILYIAFHKQIISGMTSGAVKG